MNHGGVEVRAEEHSSPEEVFGLSGETLESMSVATTDMRAPLPPNLDSTEILDDDGYGLDGWNADEFFGQRSNDAFEGGLTAEDSHNLRSVISDACLAQLPALSALLPWETGPMRLVFGSEDDEPIVPCPIMEPLPLDELSIDLASKKRKIGHPIRGSYMDIIDFGLNISDRVLR